jgi:hypothetical protein
MSCSAQTLTSAACAQGYPKLSTRDLWECIVASACAGGGGGGGGGSVQVLTYTGATPTADGLIPANPLIGAIAYKNGGGGSTYQWNTNTQAWE